MMITVFTSCLFLFLCGCGKATYDTNTLVFNKDGSIEEFLVVEFDTNVYSLDELQAETNAYAESYNGTSEKISFSEFNLENGILRCSVKYADDDAYYDYNASPLFYGTVEKAQSAGFNLKNPVISISDGKSKNLANDKELAGSHIVILNISTDISTYKDIKYVTSNVTVSGDGKRATVEGGTAYIVFD